MNEMRKLLLVLILLLISNMISAQDWSSLPVPANAGSGNEWQLQSNVSDDFNYDFSPVNSKSNFGDGKWYNFYHNTWDGPGTTYWKYQNVAVEGGKLLINASRWDQNNQASPWNGNIAKMGLPNNGVNSGCVTSNAKVQFPVYVESAISVANIGLASCFWLLSPDDTQEIDIIENYGGVNGFKHLTHISHHSFIRSPFHDYQPRDWNSWWPDSRVSTSYGWGDWAWNNGNRRYLRLGVYWKTPNHFEYYIDGELVRVMYHNAIATLMSGTWEYTYYNELHPANTTDSWGNNVGGMPKNTSSGYSDIITYATGSTYSFATLQAASNNSNGINVIDPGQYQNGEGFTKEMDIIINVESQSWLVSRGETPSDSDLQDPSKNAMEVDWVRVYKPVPSQGNVAVTGVTISPSTISLSVGDNTVLTGQVVPVNATDQTMIFTSNNTAVATVNQLGEVNALAVGNATITATSSDGGYLATSNITITDSSTPPVQGESFELEAEAYVTTGGTFNDSQVPFGMNKVNGVGVNYVNAGDWIDFEVNAIGTYELSYLISTPITSGAEVSLLVDDNVVSVMEVPNNNSWDNYTTLISSENISFSGNHIIRVLASGSNDWQWNLDKLIFTSVDTNLTIPVTGITISIPNIDLQTGSSAQLSAIVTPSDATNQNYSWRSSNPSIASISANGLVMGNVEGSAIITATSQDGNFTATSAVTVTSDVIAGTSSFIIEAEDFSNTGGVFNDSNVPYGVNKASNVGINWVNAGDWVDYTINVTSTANYDIQYMISTPITDGTEIQLLIDGGIVSTTAVPSNGSWDSYNPLNVNQSVRITEGTHTFRVIASGSSDWQWNLDKISFSSESSARLTNVKENLSGLLVYPNPSKGEINIEGLTNGSYSISVYNMNGRGVYESEIQPSKSTKIDLSHLPKGIYMVHIIGSYSTKTLKVILSK